MPLAARIAPPANAPCSPPKRATEPSRSPPITVPTSKNMVKLASTRARSGSLTEFTANAMRDGYSRAMPKASTTVPT